METKPFLSVIVPAFNEEKRLAKTLFEIDRYLRVQPYSYEILVVNDGSKDKTADVARNLIPQIRNLKLIDNQENHGKGWVVRQGMLKSQGEYRLFTDADNSTSIDQVEKILPEFQAGFEIVLGSREIKGTVIAVPQPWYRRILGDIFNLIVQIISGLWGIRDTQCGFKGLTKKAAEEIFSKCKIDRWAFDVEILVIAKKIGYKIKEIPIIWKNDPESRVGIKGIIKMLFEVIQIRWNSIGGKYKG